MRNYILMMITLVVAMCLTLLPMPAMAAWARPVWVLLVLIYWTLAMPYQFNVGCAWFAGLFLDITTGTVLGLHALAMTLVIYLVCRLHQRIHMYSLLQQAFSVFIFVLIYQAIIYGVLGLMGEQPLSHYYWLASVTSVILWPWLFVLMRDYCRWARIDHAK